MDSVKNETYLLVDVNNKSTKAILVEKTPENYKITGTGTAPTTVEAPELDVTEGVKNAIQVIEEKQNKTILDAGQPSQDYKTLCSSSASGGLHMVVAGVISMISAESAQRAALGAGALLMDQFSKDDKRQIYHKIAKMRSMKPDILLLAGGTDGGAVSQVIEMADIIKDSDVKPRFGSEFKLPVIYAGNVEIQDKVMDALGENGFAIKMVDNVRPLINKENLGPAREGIYDAYMEHVIVHSPGYETLASWTEDRIVPSQAAIGRMLYAYAQTRGVNLIGVDIGGETTDVYSVYNNVFNRSLNADIGLTYGISNISKEAGIENILRWLPPGMDERTVRNIIGNMMIKHSDTLMVEEKTVQRAVAREAVRLGIELHKGIASRLKGVVTDRTLSDMFSQALEKTLINMMKTHVIVGKGDVFREQSAEESAMILIDSLQPMGFTELYIDKTSMMAPLGNLLTHNKEAALSLFTDSCLMSLGTCISPKGQLKEGEDALTVGFRKSDGSTIEWTLKYGEVKILPFRDMEQVELFLNPNKMNLGAGKGKVMTRTVMGGELGVIIDARGRPLEKYRKSVTLMEVDALGTIAQTEV
ncbi:MAG: glutamate mutase L [Candidatus Bathyarchaeota archaeon]|nr:glutamate mutase L [Candidatus Bathyarchaeota archaeon]